VIVADSSVIVDAFASWHELHQAADAALADRAPLVAHSALEAYSVLTRLPPPFRAPADVVFEFLDQRGDGQFLVLSAQGHADLLRQLVRSGIQGGAVYDALIAATAAEAGAVIVSCDQRAAHTYRACGIEARLLSA
jgi:predicted nucleic acid-binding protein